LHFKITGIKNCTKYLSHFSFVPVNIYQGHD